MSRVKDASLRHENANHRNAPVRPPTHVAPRAWPVVLAGILGLAIAGIFAAKDVARAEPPAPRSGAKAAPNVMAKQSGELSATSYERQTAINARDQFVEGRNTFRFDTFGSEAFWGGALKLHHAIEGAALGGVGAGVSPAAAIGVGVKVDIDALRGGIREAIEHGRVNLNDPAVTLQLLQANAVVGLTGVFAGG